MSVAARPQTAERPAVPSERPLARSLDVPLALVWTLMAAWASVMAFLSVERYRAFWTGRFDLGNMVQAAWSTAHGHLLATTDAGGEQISRLAAHVDPLLVAFAPIYRVTDSPVPLLVLQAMIVATGALPAFWLGRRWLGDDRLAVAGAAVYLLYPPLEWATLTEFHPVTLAAPLLMWCIWAAEEARWVTLGVCAGLALLSKEEVGLALAMLGLWIAVRGGRRRAGAILAAVSLAWVAIAVWVIIPHYNDGRGSEFLSRYGELGSGPGDIARTLFTRPWDAVDVAVSHHRITYLLALLLPLAGLSLLAPLLAAGALPEIGFNILADGWPQYSIEYQYVAVIVPFLVASALLGLARLRAASRPGWLVRATERSGLIAVGMVVLVLLAGVRLGPIPWFSGLPLSNPSRADQYQPGPHAAVLDRAVAMVPDGARVSAGNYLGAHLSARDRIYTFPMVADADWVLVDRQRPAIGWAMDPKVHARILGRLLASGDFRPVFDRDGVLVMRRVPRP